MTDQTDTLVLEKNVRFYFGMVLFAMAWLTPALIPLALKLPISAEAKGTVSTLLLFGGPEVFGLAAVALLGKKTVQYFMNKIMSKVKSLFRWELPIKPISRFRYTIGLIMFWLPTLLAVIEFRFESMRGLYGEHYWTASIAMDVIFLLSLFVLGANFWDKFRSLFVHDAVATFPENATQENQ